MADKPLKDYPTYDVQSLRKNIEQADVNIKLFEDQIRQEEDRKRELRFLLRQCQERDDLIRRKAEQAKKAKAGADGDTELRSG